MSFVPTVPTVPLHKQHTHTHSLPLLPNHEMRVSTQAFALPLVHMIGVRDLELLPKALDYLRIRSVAQPAVLATMVGLLVGYMTKCISISI